MSTGTLVLALALLVVAGFLLGGVASFWKRSKVASGVLAVLATLALAGAVLRVV